MLLFYHKTDKIKAALEGRGFRPKIFGKPEEKRLAEPQESGQAGGKSS